MIRFPDRSDLNRPVCVYVAVMVSHALQRIPSIRVYPYVTSLKYSRLPYPKQSGAGNRHCLIICFFQLFCELILAIPDKAFQYVRHHTPNPLSIAPSMLCTACSKPVTRSSNVFPIGSSGIASASSQTCSM